jgi:uncharacterized protein DUF4145
MLTRNFFIETPTPEGLAVTESPGEDRVTIVRELGHFDYIVYEYRVRPDNPEVPWKSYSIDEPGAGFLLERVADLEGRCSEISKSNPNHIDLQRWKRSRKAARRRLRRWIQEHDASLLQVPEQYHLLVERIIGESPTTETECDAAVLQKKLWEAGAIHEFYDYERRKSDRVIIVVPGLPPELHSLLNQTEEAYFHGLFRAAIALCRAVLEDVLRRFARVRSLGVGPVPINDEQLDVLINCVPSTLLSPKGRTVAHEIRMAGNRVLHDAEASFSEDDAWRMVALTRKIVELLINRGGLKEPGRS